MITIEISNEQSHLPVDEGRLRSAVQSILQGESVARGRIGVAVVDDATIRRLHLEYLDEDEPTDVLSFPLERDDDSLEGEVIVSAETARSQAGRFGWPAEDELLLYAIHGTLHLVGYRDATPEQQVEMRRQERAYLSQFGIEARYEECDTPQKPLVGRKNQNP